MRNVIIFGLLSFILLFLLYVPSVNATATNITTDYRANTSDIANTYPLPCDNVNLCKTISSGTCWNSEAPGVTTCGTPCGGGVAWTRYTYTQSTSVDCRQKNEAECVAAFHSDGAETCSTGDKDNNNNYSNPAVNGSGDMSILRAGFCDCTVGGGYKTCCSAGNAVSASSFAVDPYDPLEGGCGGNTIAFCGGAGQPACGAAACATATPTPTPQPGCPNTLYVPPKNSPQTITANCVAGTTCNLTCADTCTDNQGQQCNSTSCTTVWGCQGGTQWFNDGTYYSVCPNNCKNCTNGTTQQTCGTALSCPVP